MKHRFYRRWGKRLLDVVLSLGALVIAALPMAVVALMLKLDSPGPVLFRQTRVGQGKIHFSMLKFRTMSIDAPANVPTHLLQDAETYCTPFQSFLRRYSIDELPQLICVLRGQMSLIGPRPALWNQYDLIAQRDKYGANDVRPGLSGWAQINGRDELSIEVKAKLDGEYVARLSFLFDLKCMLGTVVKVIRHDGVAGRSEKKEETAEVMIRK